MKLQKVIPPVCSVFKCFFNNRVISITSLAITLSLKSIKLKRRDRLIVKRMSLILPYYLPSDDIEKIVENLGRKMGLQSNTIQSISNLVSDATKNPSKYIKIYSNELKVGWNDVTNTNKNTGIFKVNKNYALYTIEYLRFVSLKPELVICDERECYPFPLGFYPSATFTGIMYDTGKLPILMDLEKQYGASNISILIKKMNPSGYAFNIIPRKNKSQAVIIMHVNNSRRWIKKVTDFQLKAFELERQVMKEHLKDVDESSVDMMIDEALYSSL